MSRTPTLLVVLILVITFPFWIALAAVAFGLVVGIFGGIIGLIAGLFGGIIGLIGGIFGGIMGLIGGIFGAIFDGPSWGFGWHPNFHFNGYIFFVLIIIVALIINKRQNR